MNLLSCTIAGLLIGGLSGFWPQGYERNRTMDLVMGAAGGFVGASLAILSVSSVRGVMIFAGAGALLGAALLIMASRYFGGSHESDAAAQRSFRPIRTKSALIVPFSVAPVVAYPRSPKRDL